MAQQTRRHVFNMLSLESAAMYQEISFYWSRCEKKFSLFCELVYRTHSLTEWPSNAKLLKNITSVEFDGITDGPGVWQQSCSGTVTESLTGHPPWPSAV
jgi:hypothetical protein